MLVDPVRGVDGLPWCRECGEWQCVVGDTGRCAGCERRLMEFGSRVGWRDGWSVEQYDEFLEQVKRG